MLNIKAKIKYGLIGIGFVTGQGKSAAGGAVLIPC